MSLQKVALMPLQKESRMSLRGHGPWQSPILILRPIKKNGCFLTIKSVYVISSLKPWNTRRIPWTHLLRICVFEGRGQNTLRHTHTQPIERFSDLCVPRFRGKHPDKYIQQSAAITPANSWQWRLVAQSRVDIIYCKMRFVGCLPLLILRDKDIRTISTDIHLVILLEPD